MPPQTKIKTRRSRPTVKFTVRRIANKNPRNARTFRQFRRKLSRVTAGLVVFGLIVSGSFLASGKLKSDIIDAITNTDDATCAAPGFVADFEKLTTQMSELSREFPDLIENLNFCKGDSCAAEDQIYASENQVWQLEKDLTTLRTNEQRAREEFTTEFAQKEDNVLFCANTNSCQAAENALVEAQNCAKDFKKIEQLFIMRDTAEEEYSLVTEKGKRESAVIYVKKLMDSIFKDRDRVAKNKEDYAKCVDASDESVCQKYLQNAKDAQEKIVANILELGKLQIDIEDTLTALEKDIVALEIGRKDPQNTNENEGLGWCNQETQSKKNTLFVKISTSATQKLVYELALKDLSAKKLALQASLQAELEAAAMHAAAEKAAAEEATAAAEAQRISDQKRAQAEIIFGIWSAIRNTF